MKRRFAVERKVLSESPIPDAGDAFMGERRAFMSPMLVSTSAALLLVLSASHDDEVSSLSLANQNDRPREVHEDWTQPEGFPVLGRWMIGPDGTPAHWLGEIYMGKKLREPI